MPAMNIGVTELKFVTPRTKLVKITDIKGAHWNPPEREKRGIKGLADSINKWGFLGGILLQSSAKPPFNLIDGHRRTAACRLLGATHIPAYLIDAPQAEVYAVLNATFRPMGGKDNMHIWFEEPTALPTSTQGKFRVAITSLGEDLLKEMRDQGLTLHAFDIARNIARSCSRNNDNEFLMRTIRWFMEFKQQNTARSALNNDTPPSRIEKCITTMQPLRHNYDVGESESDPVT